MFVPATDQVIDRTAGSNIGDATAGGGLAAAFDGTISQTQAASANKAAANFTYVGKTLAATKVITRATTFGSNDNGYVSAANPTTTIDLYSKAPGSAPANSTDGTLVGTLAFTDTANESATRRSIVATLSPSAGHAWVRASQGGGAATMGVSELVLYETWTPPLLDSNFTLDNPVIGWQNLLSSTLFSSTTAEAANPVTNLANLSTSLIWRGTSVIADEFITLNVTGLATFDYVAVARQNFASAGIAVSLEGRAGSDPYVEIIQPFTPTDDSPLIMRFPPQTGLTNVRIRLQPGTNVPQASVVYLGAVLVMQRRLYVPHEPMTMARETNSVAAMSDSGQFLGRIVLGQYSAATATFANLKRDWVRTYLDPFLSGALDKPFFFAWRPNQYPLETAFCWFPPGNHPKPQNQRGNGMMSISLPLQGIST